MPGSSYLTRRISRLYLEDMTWHRLSTRTAWLGLILIAGLGTVFYLVLARGAKISITQQLLQRRQTIARAEAASLVAFFQDFGDSVAVLARLGSLESRDAETLQDMEVFVEQWRDSDLVGGVVLTDRSGVVRFNANVSGTPDIGASLADRDYFVWAKQELGEGGHFVGQPVVSRLGASRGQVIVVVASPVFQNNTFTGVIAASVRLQPLAERYLELMKISDTAQTYLIDERGDLFYGSSLPDEVGEDLKNILTVNEEGTLQTREHLVAYAPVKVASQNWFLVITSSADRVIDLTTPFYVREAAVLLFTSLTLVLFGIIAARESQKSS